MSNFSYKIFAYQENVDWNEEDAYPDVETETLQEAKLTNLKELISAAQDYSLVFTSSSDGSGWLNSESQQDYRTGIYSSNTFCYSIFYKDKEVNNQNIERRINKIILNQ